MRGVWPTGAQLAFSGETSEKPVSSRKIKVASHSSHFFYLGPLLFTPLFDGRVGALNGDPLRALVAPAHAVHQVPDTAGVITYPVQIEDHPPNPVQRPVVIGIPMGIGSFQEFASQLLLLLGGQLTTSAWWAFGRAFSLLARLGFPVINCLSHHPDTPGHFTRPISLG